MLTTSERPQKFADMIGQETVIRSLINQSKKDTFFPTYVFSGKHGCGKTTSARILAKAILCRDKERGEPCGKCAFCKAIAEGTELDVTEIDGASNNGVDKVRELIEKVQFRPVHANRKVYIIDEVHMLSTGAFNALLKTLEEPPSYVVFILATTEVQKLPITILSRCQRYDFHRITIDDIEGRLRTVVDAEGIRVEDKALRYIAKTADGSMRDSLSLLDQCIAFNYGEELTYDKVLGVLGAVDTEVFSNLFSALYEQDVNKALTILSDVVIQGRELTQFVNDFVWYLRNLMLVQASDQMEDVVDISTDNLKTLKEQAAGVSSDAILRFIRIFSELSANIRYATQKRILIEITLIRLCKPQMDRDEQDSFEDRLRILEEHDEKNSKVLSGIQTGQIAVASAGGAGMAASPVVKEKKTLERAVPEDIQKLVKSWPQAVARMGNPMKTYMQRAKLSLGNDDRLQVVFDNKQLADKYSSGEFVQEFQDTLDAIIGKHVEYEARFLEPTQNFEENYVNLQSINFDVVTEDEEEEN